jgi:hypothetical protein
MGGGGNSAEPSIHIINHEIFLVKYKQIRHMYRKKKS